MYGQGTILQRGFLIMARIFARMSLPAVAASLATAAASPAVAQTRVADGDARCRSLSDVRLDATTITGATLVARGAGAAALGLPAAAGLPAFCRVVAHVRNAPDSDVAVEVWLPVDGWAGVFHGNGNGGFAGTLQAGYGGMLNGLKRGYATATTDTGTAPATMLDGDALVGHPRKWRDWGRLSTHVMTVTGKALARAFYGRAAARSYYTGCSTGGQQGLIEALHYPADYDAILVGAPVISRTWGHAAVAWDYAAAHRGRGSLLTDVNLTLLHRAALAACRRQGAALPGDAFVADPLGCTFDPASLACREAVSDQCLSTEQIATARAFYSGPTARDGRPAFFGWLPGSEGPGRFGWSFLQSAANGQPQFAGLFKWVFGADWDWRGFDIGRDMPVVDAALDPVVNDATRGSLAAFRARGGKLIVYHGLADTLVPPAQSVAFYERQARQLGGPARMRDVARLFLAPGVQHCGGGDGADSFNSAIAGIPAPAQADAEHDLFAALIAWRERGRVPDRVVATKFDGADPKRIAFQRPLCGYPRKAAYVGRGSTAVADRFACAPARDRAAMIGAPRPS